MMIRGAENSKHRAASRWAPDGRTWRSAVAGYGGQCLAHLWCLWTLVWSRTRNRSSLVCAPVSRPVIRIDRQARCVRCVARVRHGHRDGVLCMCASRCGSHCAHAPSKHWIFTVPLDQHVGTRDHCPRLGSVGWCPNLGLQGT